MFHFSQLAWKFANQGTMQLTTRNEFSEDMDLKMSLLGDVKAPPCPLGCLFGAISPLSYGHFSWFQMYSPASWWKGDQYLSLGERNSRERGWHTKLCVQWQKSQVAIRSSQKSGMPHSRMHCIPNLYSYVHNDYCQHYQVKLPLFFALSTPVPKTPLQTSFNNEHSRCTSSGTSPSSPFFTRFSLGGNGDLHPFTAWSQVMTIHHNHWWHVSTSQLKLSWSVELSISMPKR